MDIVEKLRATEMRETGFNIGGIPVEKLIKINPDGFEAADEIERLRDEVDFQLHKRKEETAEIERLREALKSISKIPNSESAYGIIQTFIDDALKEKE